MRSTSVGLEVAATIACAGLNPNFTYISISWCSAQTIVPLAIGVRLISARDL